jgi:hypothetical protein
MSTDIGNPHAALGQTYFIGVSGVAALNRLWEHQLRFHFEQAYRLDQDGLAEVRNSWNHVVSLPQTEMSGPATAS